MKRILLILLFITAGAANLYASHISGGELFYEYLGPGSAPNTDSYKITMRLFRECTSDGAELKNENPRVGIFSYPANFLFDSVILIKQWTGPEPPRLSNTPEAIPCLTGNGFLCYQIGTYSATIELPRSPSGYTLAWIRCCRQNLTNVNDEPYADNPVGATFTTRIPGTDLVGLRGNNSPQFIIKDTQLVCAGNRFNIDFSATDIDGDSLSYTFCAAYDGGSKDNPVPDIPSRISFSSLPYLAGYSGSSPLGSGVVINQVTGYISGKAPSTPGKYVVNVCVYEWKGPDTLLNIHRKDFIMDVADCNIPSATLDPEYLTCDGFNLTFFNSTPSPSITSYYWEFGDPNSTGDTSLLDRPTYTYADSGTYLIKLVVNRGQACTDSTTAIAEVYPGFIPDFAIDGSCFSNPYSFKDLTTSKYGIVDSWRWDFGDPSTLADTSIKQNPVYYYSSTDTTDITLIVTNNKGCLDTITKQLIIKDKPYITLPFTDTLICSKDSLQLHSDANSSTATYSWIPGTKINDPNIANPLVYPNDTTVYVVTVNDKGCINSDSITVNVIDKVSLFMGNDTTICASDSVQLNPVTDGIKFTWSPAPGLTNTTILSPVVAPASATTYSLTSAVGGCKTTGFITVTPVPYPVADAGADTGICFGNTVLLHADIAASQFTWSPVNSLLHENTLTPLAGPQSTTSYILTVTDTLGCPKPASDTVVVNVVPPVHAFAGNDTIIVINQPLQLNASGGTIYSWSPATGMNDPTIPNPLIILGPQYDSITYKLFVTTPEGCSGTDDIKVTVFKTIPDIILPSAFTPNGDGRNDKLKPLLLGIKQFNFFRVFNRWGNMLYSTSSIGFGWDGTFSGQLQPTGTYVYVAQGVDYVGKLITKKGTVVLIR